MDARELPTSGVVVASSRIGEETTKPEAIRTLVGDLVGLGVSAPVARQLVKKYSEEIIQEQVAALPFRVNVKDPGAVLVQSIKESWALPRPYLDAKMQAEHVSQSQADREGLEAAAKAAERARRDRLVKIDAYLAVLSESETEAITAEATRQIQEGAGGFWRNRPIPAVLLNATIRTMVAARLGLGPESG